MKLNFSKTSFSAIGTAFTAMQTDLKTLSKDELKIEANSNSVVNDLSQSLDGDKTSIIFNDPLNNSLVKLNLSSENIDKLQKHFSSDNFYKEDGGSIRLNGNANSFVSGWFGDIAYKREFLSADANKDGKLDDEEFKHTKSSWSNGGTFTLANGKLEEVTANITDTYNDSKKSKPTLKSNSIQGELNQTINIDANLDKNLSLAEIAQKTTYNKDTEEYIMKNSTGFEIPTWLVDWDTIFKEQPSEEQAKALQKLKSANGDESVLSDDEKKAIQDQLSAIKKELEKQKDSNNNNSNNTPENNSTNAYDTTNNNNTNNTKQSDLSSVVSEIRTTLTESSSFIDERV